MPAISIAHETAEADIMKLKPRDPKTQTLVTSQYVICTFPCFSPLNIGGPEEYLIMTSFNSVD